MEASIHAEKAAALNQMEFERKERERKAEVQREYEERQRRQRELQQEKLKKKRVAPQAGAKAQVATRVGGQKRKLENRPFDAENDVDEQLLDEYMHRKIPTDDKLPKVALIKRNGVYWLGQRRFSAKIQEGVLVVEPSLDPFSQWLEKAERVEALRMKGMASAGFVLKAM